MNINNKDVNIRKYDGNCLISDIVKLEIGECDDCDIKYMNDDFDLCTNRLNSINSKKINQVEMEMKFWIIVHPDTENRDFIVRQDALAGLSRPNFFVSQCLEV